MNMEQFEHALDRYGSDVSRWPPALRTEAARLVASDDGAGRRAAAAQQLEATLADAVKPMPVDAALIGRIMAGIDGGARPDVGLHATPRLAAWVGAAMIAFLSAGYVAGTLLPASDGEDTFASIMFGSAWVTDAETVDTGSLL